MIKCCKQDIRCLNRDENKTHTYAAYERHTSDQKTPPQTESKGIEKRYFVGKVAIRILDKIDFKAEVDPGPQDPGLWLQ